MHFILLGVLSSLQRARFGPRSAEVKYSDNLAHQSYRAKMQNIWLEHVQTRQQTWISRDPEQLLRIGFYMIVGSKITNKKPQ